MSGDQHVGIGSRAAAPPDWSPSLYVEAKQIASLLLSIRKPGDSISPTIMVHEAFVRLERSGIRSLPDGEHERRGAFFALVRHVMRSIIVDWIRRRTSPKWSGTGRLVPTQGDTQHRTSTNSAEAVNDAAWQLGDSLAKAMQELERIDARKAIVAEFRCLRGMSTIQIATALGVSERTVELDWAGAKVWLKRQLTNKPQNI